jgi:ubiquinol-cytochrome c reductase cytochrome c subunit
VRALARPLLALLLALPVGAGVGLVEARGADAPNALVSSGRQLYVTGCSSCHGLSAEGIAGSGPSLRGVGAQAADFYLSTGRMPLYSPRDVPVRKPPAYSGARIAALTAYIASLGGPAVPSATGTGLPELSSGLRAFTESCAGCHGALARGGVVTGAVAPSLMSATRRQIIEAMRIGPYVMPRYSKAQIDDRTASDIAAYVLSVRHPDDRGGWGIGHLGPVPEGLVAWLVGALALLVIARLLGQREKA